MSRTASSSGSAFVSRFDVGQISSTISCSRNAAISVASPAARMPCPIRSGSQRLDHVADLLAADLAALLADVDRHAEPAAARLLDERRDLAVVVAAAVGPRPRDVDADDPARRPVQRLLDDDRVLLLGEGAVHHQDQPRANLRVLEPARSSPRIAARMMWSRSRSPPRFRFIGLKRSSSVVMPCERYAPPIAAWMLRSTASGDDWISSVQW